MHSDVTPERRREDSPRVREAVPARRPAMAYRATARRREWFSISAAAMALAAGVVAAYLSVSAPVGNLNDVLSQQEPQVEPVVDLFGPGTAQTFNQDGGFAG